MPAKSTEVHGFVRSLSPAEIKAFKHFCAYQKGDKEYLKFFDLLRKMKVYDERKVAKALEGTKAFKNLSRTKDYLYDLIVRSLAVYYKEPGYHLDILVREISVEFRRRHHKNALKLIQKAKQFARDRECFEVWLNVLRLERKILLKQVEKNDFADLLLGNSAEMANVNAMHLNYLKYLEVENEVIIRAKGAYLQGRKRNEAEILRVKDSELFQSDASPLTIRAKQKYFRIWFEMAKVEGKRQKAVELLKKELLLFQSNDFLREDERASFYNSLFLRGLFFQQEGDFFNGMRVLNELRAAAKVDLHHQDVLFERITMSQLTYGFSTEDVDVISAATHSLGQTDKVERVRIEVRILLWWYRARIALKQKDYPDVIRWLRPVLDLPKINVRTDLQISARILHLVALFELKEWDQIHYRGAHYARFIKRNSGSYEYEKVVVSALRKLPNQKSNHQMIAFFQKLSTKLEAVFSQEHEEYALHYFDLPYWIAKKVEEGAFF